jgi:type I restriction enzyme M protein
MAAFTTCLPGRQEKRINRDKVSLDIFCVREESLEDSDNLPDPVLAQEMVEDLEAGLERVCEIAADLGEQHTNLKGTYEAEHLP